MLLCRRKQHLEQPWPVFWIRKGTTRLLGNSLAHLNERDELSIEATYGRERVTSDPANTYLALRRPLFLEGRWTSIVSRFSPNNKPQIYAHWLLDALPRLAPLDEFPTDTRIVIPPQQLRYQTESLQIMGLLDRCRLTSETDLLVEDYYFSSPTSMIVCFNPYAVSFLRRTFLPHVSNARAFPRRFFVRRTSYGRNMANESEVLEFFEKNGWPIIDTAKLGFAEQIQLFAGAEAVCAIHGSGTANIVWCAKGCKVLELFATDYLAGDQEWIAQCVGVEYHFAIFVSDHKLNAIIDLETLKAKLQELKLL